MRAIATFGKITSVIANLDTPSLDQLRDAVRTLMLEVARRSAEIAFKQARWEGYRAVIGLRQFFNREHGPTVLSHPTQNRPGRRPALDGGLLP